MSAVISVLLVDDHAVVREGYRRLLESRHHIRVIGEAGNAGEACELARARAPDVIVMDIALPGVSGIEAMRRMLAQQPQLRVLMFSMYDDAVFAARALQAGACGYLSKASAPEVLIEAVCTVAGGQAYVSADVSQALQRHALQTRSAIDTLTAREFEVLRLLVNGETVRQIGTKLGLSEKTVANHQSAIREKLGARNGAQLARIAARLGLSSMPRSDALIDS